MNHVSQDVDRRRFLQSAAAAIAAPVLWGSIGRDGFAEPAAFNDDALIQRAKEHGFLDDWKRPDGPVGNGWRSAHDDHPTWWDVIQLHNGSPVNSNPDKGKIVQTDNSGARTAIYQDFGEKFKDNFSIGTWWNGDHRAVGATAACVNLEDPDWAVAFCYEPNIAGGVFVLWAMGRRPDQIRVIKGGGGNGHKDGTPMFLEMQVRGNMVTCLADGKEILTNEIPEKLVGSSTHALIVDVNPVPDRPANFPVISGPFVLSPLPV